MPKKDRHIRKCYRHWWRMWSYSPSMCWKYHWYPPIIDAWEKGLKAGIDDYNSSKES